MLGDLFPQSDCYRIFVCLFVVKLLIASVINRNIVIITCLEMSRSTKLVVKLCKVVIL